MKRADSTTTEPGTIPHGWLGGRDRAWAEFDVSGLAVEVRGTTVHAVGDGHRSVPARVLGIERGVHERGSGGRFILGGSGTTQQREREEKGWPHACRG